MVAQIDDIDFFVTGSEQEALILELNLIKQHRPRFNVRLKDDKTLPYLRIDLSEDWPRVYITRRLEEDGAHYFGPFANARSLKQTLKLIKKLFPFRACKRTITGRDSRACLDYYIGECVAPCIGAVSRQEYGRVVWQVILFLEGKQERVVRKLRKAMAQAARNLDFEKAALLRDQIGAVEDVIEGQRIAATVRGEQDVVAFASDNDHACVQVFFVRRGKLVGRESFVLQGTRAEEPAPIMTSFIKQFYSTTPYVPPLILIQYPVEDQKVIEGWLQGRRGSRVSLRVPSRGSKRQLMAMVVENARQGLQQLKFKQLAAPAAIAQALGEITRELGLPGRPQRLEGYDISNIQGKAAVGSMVVFDQGRPRPSLYRRFRIKMVSGADDYAMLREVLQRRFQRTTPQSGEAVSAGGWGILPDLVLVDGGRGQLNAALLTMGELGIDTVPVASLAKENEEVFIPHKKAPIVLPPSSPGLQLLQRLRDEAHRFALGYHRRIRHRETFVSVLDAIPGIGPKRKRALFKQFGSVSAIQQAPLTQLAAVTGMNQRLAKLIKESL